MSQSLMIGGSFESYKYIEDILLKMAATTSHESSSFLEMIQDENHANLVILHIPIFSLDLSTHSTNPLPVSAHAWLFKTPQIHPPTHAHENMQIWSSLSYPYRCTFIFFPPLKHLLSIICHTHVTYLPCIYSLDYSFKTYFSL